MAKKPAKKKPSKYEEKIVINTSFDEALKALGKQVKKNDKKGK